MAAPLTASVKDKSPFPGIGAVIMRFTKSNRKKAQYLVNLLRNPECFAPASLRTLLQRIELEPSLRWISLSSENNVFLHNQQVGKDWITYEVNNGALEETFCAPFSIAKSQYQFEYIGTLSKASIDWPNRPFLVTLDVQFFLHLLKEYERAEAAAWRRATAAMTKAGAVVSKIQEITTRDAWL